MIKNANAIWIVLAFF